MLTMRHRCKQKSLSRTATTSLCPTETFRGAPLYRDGCAPDVAERNRRVATYWQPYHDTLRDELKRLRAQHPHMLLWEAHSIASVLPRLFGGKLPDLNIGTQDYRTAAPSVQEGSSARPRRVRSRGWRTAVSKAASSRHFGAPYDGLNVVQLEMCQSTYMSEDAPFDYLPDVAQKVEPVVRGIVTGTLEASVALNTSARR
jgi:N-formylglutamate deformylase